MSKKSVFFSAVAITAMVVCFFVGYRMGVQKSLLKEDREGLVAVTLGAYQAAEATNWTKVQSILSVELFGFTREYERHYGLPTGTNGFAKHFAEAKTIADQIEKRMVPVTSALQSALGSNITVKIEK